MSVSENKSCKRKKIFFNFDKKIKSNKLKIYIRIEEIFIRAGFSKILLQV